MFDQKNLCVQFERGGLVFAINLNPTESVSDYSFLIEGQGDYRFILSSDEKEFGGHDRTNATVSYPVSEGKLTIYSPRRTVLIFGERNQLRSSQK